MASERGGLSIEYSKSSRSTCKECGSPISEGSLRIGLETKSSYHDGWDTTWHHLKCGNKKYGAVHFKSTSELKGWQFIKYADYVKIATGLGETIPDTPAEKKRKEENEALWNLKDRLEVVPTKILKAILEANGITYEKASPDRILTKCADGMQFGKLMICPECKNNTVANMCTHFECHGWISSFTRCTWKSDTAKRYLWKLPPAIIKGVKFFDTWTPPAGHPTEPFPTAVGSPATTDPSASASAASASSETPAAVDNGPVADEEEVNSGEELRGIWVCFAGTEKELGTSRASLEKLVEEHGGSVVDKPDDATIMIAPQSEIDKKKKTKKVSDALEMIPIMTPKFLEDICAADKTKAMALRKADGAKEYLLAGASFHDTPFAVKGVEVGTTEEGACTEGAVGGKRSREVVQRKEPVAGSDILKLDPQIKTCDVKAAANGSILVTHDSEYGYTTYHVMLNVTDIQAGTNKYYRMQVIKCSAKNYYFWICWGRVGTSVGDFRIYNFKSEANAIAAFAEKFEYLSANKWEDRCSFVKKPGKYFMVDLDDGVETLEQLTELEKRKQEKKLKGEESPTSAMKPSLDPRVSDIIKLIFDKRMMENQLKNMNIDVDKMPLGKISKRQIQNAYKVLNTISDAIQGKTASNAMLMDATNEFYTLVPHNFGVNNPPLLSSIEDIQKKIELLDVLCDIEIATSLMKQNDTDGDELMQNYKSLNTEINPLDKKCDMYSLIERLVSDTHDHFEFTNWNLIVDDILEIKRKGENERFKPAAEKISNRHLLWHGSRLTNYVGILSQGLRIAPPEAPKSGYRFGKGIYFADIVSKSATYTRATPQAPTIVMLLCEVALGNQNKLKSDQYMEKAPAGTDSTFALGMKAPSPKGDVVIEDGVTVSPGKCEKTGLSTACSHNEFIIYDISQVQIRYAVKMRFNYK
eukprot:TRINITY_DN22736_c0_g1_i1.p1 TRINITY_DN22736_c0_g1~~TRINITY_DN22736_c0_g1_i1.p1  ORF type:complete len:932 (-),score=252.85 TRINITY_DN22736_c0_g1_i1:98-2872(-)